MNKTMIRQGDVLLVRVRKPKMSREVENGPRLILAHGEVTGHAHVLTSEESVVHEAAGVTLLEVRAAMAALIHDEHATIQIQRGWYEVRRQREYSPEAIRNVTD